MSLVPIYLPRIQCVPRLSMSIVPRPSITQLNLQSKPMIMLVTSRQVLSSRSLTWKCAISLDHPLAPLSSAYVGSRDDLAPYPYRPWVSVPHGCYPVRAVSRLILLLQCYPPWSSGSATSHSIVFSNCNGFNWSRLGIQNQASSSCALNICLNWLQLYSTSCLSILVRPASLVCVCTWDTKYLRLR